MAGEEERDVRTELRPLQAKLVKQEQQNIDAQFEKKRKGAEVAQKMYVVRRLGLRGRLD